LLGDNHRTDGSMHRAFLCGIPGARWYEAGRVSPYSEDRKQSHRMILRSADLAKEVVEEVLASSGISKDQGRFFAGHQPNRWFRSVVQEHIGLAHAHGLDTFPWAGSIGSANIPLQLSVATREGILRAGDVAVLFSVASGMTCSATVIRWGVREGSLV